MAIGHIVTLGFGTGSFAGSIGKVVTLGYTVGEAAAPFVSYVRYRPRQIDGETSYRPETSPAAAYRPSATTPDNPYRPVNPQQT